MRRLLLAFLLFIEVLPIKAYAMGQPTKDNFTKGFFTAPELLCYIRNLDLLTGSGKGLTCGEESGPAMDLFFMSSRWHRNVEITEDCDCDQDFDGVSGCDEFLMCLSPVDGDSDGDCLPDGLELLIGTDPSQDDSDGDGTQDGDEDNDQNGIPDRDDDYDQDALTNCEEAPIPSWWTRIRTDGLMERKSRSTIS